ncbi:MAG: hypothetical protein WBD14_01100 [Phycisphaerae bacterium]
MTTDERLAKVERELTHEKRCIWCLAFAGAICLVVVFAWIFFTRPGRYAISGTGPGFAYVLDTKTSELWVRSPATKTKYLGTIDEP